MNLSSQFPSPGTYILHRSTTQRDGVALSLSSMEVKNAFQRIEDMNEHRLLFIILDIIGI